MPTQIEIQPDLVEKLSQMAKIKGVSIDTLLRNILKQLDKPDDSENTWRLLGSMELLDDDLESASRQISQSLKEAILESAQKV